MATDTPGPAAYLNINGSMWQSNPSNSMSEFTSACFCQKTEKYILITICLLSS